MGDRIKSGSAFVVDKPWQTRQFNRQLAWYAEVLDAVDMPWPARIDAIESTISTWMVHSRGSE
jgi:hypothetical protein